MVSKTVRIESIQVDLCNGHRTVFDVIIILYKCMVAAVFVN